MSNVSFFVEVNYAMIIGIVVACVVVGVIVFVAIKQVLKPKPM